MNLEIARIPLGGHPLAQTYESDFARIDAFYPSGRPDLLSSYRETARRVDLAFGGDRRASLAAELAKANTRLETTLRSFADEGGFFVATGQQAGLFGGPLMVIYKALSAVWLARRLADELGVPVLPLFVVASEDHDWLEVNHTHVVDPENRLVRIEVGPESAANPAGVHPSIGRIRLGGDVEGALESMAAALPESEFRAEYVDRLHSAYTPGSGFATAFTTFLSDLLSPFSCLVVDSDNPALKNPSREVLWRDWSERLATQEGSLERVEALEAAGYKPQVTLASQTTNLFVNGKLGRDRLVWEASTARTRRSGEVLSDSELRSLIEDEPERVSPGVLLRPVATAAALPIIAHVVGPAEIAYLAQSSALFDLHGVTMPVGVPRASFELIEPKVQRVLTKYELESEDLAEDSARKISELIKSQTPQSLQNAHAALEAAVEGRLAELEEVALEYDPGARSAVGSGRRAVLDGIAALRKKLEARVKEKNRVMETQLEKVAVNLYPNGELQERVLSVGPYLARYGPDLLESILDECVTGIT